MMVPTSATLNLPTSPQICHQPSSSPDPTGHHGSAPALSGRPQARGVSISLALGFLLQRRSAHTCSLHLPCLPEQSPGLTGCPAPRLARSSGDTPPLQPTMAPHHWQKRAEREVPISQAPSGSYKLCRHCPLPLHHRRKAQGVECVSLQENGFSSRGNMGNLDGAERTRGQGLCAQEERGLHLIGVRNLDAGATEEVRALVLELAISPLPSPPCC